LTFSASAEAAAGIAEVLRQGRKVPGGAMRDSNRTLLRFVLEKAGVQFMPKNGGGPGVRLVK